MAGFARHVEAYDAADVQIVALSADDEEGARSMRDDESLGFPVLYGLDVDEAEETLGTYVERGDRTHLQPAQFVLDPEGRIRLACYSSGAVGRLTAEEALAQVEDIRGAADGEDGGAEAPARAGADEGS